MNDGAIKFGDFKVLPRERLLFDRDVRVSLGSRAFDMLLALIERRGTYLSNEELAQLVWPDTTVAEVSLRVNLSSIRKALHDNRAEPRFIMNVPGRGYCFIGNADPMRQLAITSFQIPASFQQCDQPA